MNGWMFLECCQGCGRRGTLCTVTENTTGATTMGNSKEVPQKFKNRTTIWSSNPTSGYISEGNENRIRKRVVHSSVHCRITHNSHSGETTSLSIDRRMDKMWWYIYIYICIYSYVIEYYLAVRNKETLPFSTTWTKREYFAKWDKSDRERQILYDLTHMWNLKKPDSQKQGVEWWSPGAGVGKWGRCCSERTNFQLQGE